MAFRPVKYEKGKLVAMPCATTQTITKGLPLEDNGSGYLQAATNSSGTDIHYVAMQTVTTTSNGQLVLCINTENVLFEADTDGTAWLQAEVGTYCDLAANELTLDTSATSYNQFYILKGIGTAGTDTKVLGFFATGVANS